VTGNRWEDGLWPPPVIPSYAAAPFERAKRVAPIIALTSRRLRPTDTTEPAAQESTALTANWGIQSLLRKLVAA